MFNIGALIITYTTWGSYYNYSLMGPKTLFEFLAIPRALGPWLEPHGCCGCWNFRVGYMHPNVILFMSTLNPKL